MELRYRRILVLLMVLATVHGLFGQEELSKTIKESYAFTDTGELLIDNKYGNILIEGWDKNSITISASIKVRHKKPEHAAKLLDRINARIQETDGFIMIQSEIDQRNSSFFSRYFNKANPFDFDRSNVQIDYTVYLPANAAIEINNKFGDVIINGWMGKLKMSQEHGDLWINNDIPKAHISLKYGKIKARYVDYAIIDLKNGSLVMNKSSDLRLNSSGSDIEIDVVKSLELNSNKDEVNLRQVASLHGELRFSTLSLERLENELHLGMKITELHIAQIVNTGAVLNIDQESSEISINISELAFELDATLEEGLLRLPKSFRDINSKMIDKRHRIREITASYGTTPRGKMSIRGLKGVILLKEIH